ncbi:MAG: hypothetical protein F6K00_25600 [Leptolyngbya sp. SIOISBB]|nr:hypothetical protein [Leptolyngbya sp. SIOISBB]
MIGFHPKHCRFCGTTPDAFIRVEEGSATHGVKGTVVMEQASQLKSFPQLGYEYVAKKIDTGDVIVGIDCLFSLAVSFVPMHYRLLYSP